MKLPKLLKDIGTIADQNKINAFVVGGFVRNLLLGVKDKDIDIVVEANAINFAKILIEKINVGATLAVAPRGQGQALPLHITMHEGFKTATIEFCAFKIDFVTARKERYKRPAALPDIKPATIREDLFRRDFTVNAMAVSLNQPTFGKLVDFFLGMDDLKNKIIRVLHDGSFMDDPTRILRAVRFQQHLGFKIEPHTERLMRDAINVGILAKLKNQRLNKEIDLILREPNSSRIIFKLRELGADIIYEGTCNKKAKLI
jgi:tRNA nucleotidyltransferase (CCA-adding enzyme)